MRPAVAAAAAVAAAGYGYCSRLRLLPSIQRGGVNSTPLCCLVTADYGSRLSCLPRPGRLGPEWPEPAAPHRARRPRLEAPDGRFLNVRGAECPKDVSDSTMDSAKSLGPIERKHFCRGVRLRGVWALTLHAMLGELKLEQQFLLTDGAQRSVRRCDKSDFRVENHARSGQCSLLRRRS